MVVELSNLKSRSVAELWTPARQLLRRQEARQAENASLKEQLLASRRAIAPLSKGEPDPVPRMAGRGEGEERFERRAMRVPGPVDMVEVIRALLESPESLFCGTSLDVVERAAFVEGILAQPDHRNRLFRVEHCSCLERGLLGALNASKLLHCSKNERVARVYETVMSVISTLALRGDPPSSGLSAVSSRASHYRRLWLADQILRTA